MNESEDNTKYGECRCCFALGNHRDLMKEYEWNGAREVYFKIFLECFNVFLCTKAGKSNLICTSCVLRLRDATSFKKMVLDAEQNLTSCTVKQEGSDPIDPSSSTMIEVEIKKEPDVSLESSDAEENGGNSEDDTMSEQEGPVKIKEYNPSTYAETVRAAYCKMKNNNMMEKLASINNTTVRATPSRMKNKNRTEKLAYIHNTTLILENSNVTPFKAKYQTGYSCFYCSVLFHDLQKIREHQQKHTKTELKTVLFSQGAEAFIVYVDVTDLKCTVCTKEILNLKELKSHLDKRHNLKLQDCPDRIIPFKLTPNVFECQVCECNFETFGAVERHMNVHYRNYVCEECGTGFATVTRFKVHSKQHKEGSFECETCKKVYATPKKLKNHTNLVHKMMKRFKCMKCDKRFTEYFRRQQHLVEAHGEAKLEYKCNVCDKIFDRKYLLSAHMKRDHLEQRDYHCEICSYTCFAKNELKYHMIKHNGSRIFECSVCKKSYARKKTLREHMRIHNNDRRYACQACGQAFVQNYSLKGHIKTHHPELQAQ